MRGDRGRRLLAEAAMRKLVAISELASRLESLTAAEQKRVGMSDVDAACYLTSVEIMCHSQQADLEQVMWALVNVVPGAEKP